MDASRILEGLNEAQRNAVTTEASVLQILAPPGSGKTKTLTSRVSWLIFHQGYKPWNVICLTFTIKSAREMKDRIAKQIGQGLENKLILGTFHSVCLRYLRNYGHLIGLRKGFDIADSSDSQAIVKRIIKQKNLTIDPSTARSRISHNKAKNVSYLDIARQQKKSVEQQEFIVVYEAYQSYLESANLLDYDDLLVRCVELLRNHPTCVVNVESVLIDEFQDTNHIQFDLMQLFSTYCKRITTVGDPDQSIYGWRAAEIENLNKMQRLFPETLVLNLENNYRSSPRILRAAQVLIEQDESRPQKTMVATHQGGSAPVLRRLFNPKTQAAWIVTEIKRSRAVTGNSLLSYSDYAVLIRSAALSRQIESAMGNAGIPYRMVGGLRFFDRKEIKVLLDYMRVVNHPENNDAIARIINYPPRGIGDKTIKTIHDKAASTGRLWWELIKDEIGHKKPIGLRDNLVRAVRGFYDIINSCGKALLDTTAPKYPLDLLELIINKLNFDKHLEKEYPEDHEGRWANIEELKVQASEYGETKAWAEDNNEDGLPEIEGIQRETSNTAQEALSKFLGNIALSTEIQSEQDLDEAGQPLPKVTISTIHAAKGLEWPVVFIPCVYRGSIPHSRSEDEDEERRLLYVAMTRAQALLYMTFPGQGQMNEDYNLSPFLDDTNVMRCLMDRAPSIYDQIAVISSILRRDCPAVAQINHAVETIECVEDDEVTWPLDGSKGVGNDGSNYFKDQEFQSKELKDDALSRRKVQPGCNPEFPGSSTSTAVNIQAGFVSATSQLKRALPVDLESLSANLSRSSSASKKSRSNKTTPNQPGIGAFFGKACRSASVEPELPPSKPALIQSSRLNSIAKQVAATNNDLQPDPPIVRSKFDSRTTTEPQVLSSLSKDLLNRRLPRSVALQRYKTTMDEHTSGTGYVFLSSSPTKPEHDHSILPQTSSSTGMTRSTCTNLTSHSTTMSTLAERSANQGRSLGVGRPFKPWSSKSGTSFSVPKISRPSDR